MQYLGRLDWSLGPGPRIYSTAQAQHAGTGPLDVGLRRFEFTAMGMLGKSDRQCRLLVQATNLHCCYLSPPAAETAHLRYEQQKMEGAIPSVSSSHRVASHGTAPHRMAPHEQEREVRTGSTAKATATAAGRGHIR